MTHKILRALRLQTCFCFLIILSLSASLQVQAGIRQSGPLNVALAGLSHDHVYLVMHHYQQGEVHIIGIAEKNPELISRFKKNYHLPDSIFYPDIATLLKHKKPDVVMAFDPISEHIAVVKACAPLHVNVMVEKPLATTVADAEQMVSLAKQYHIQVLTDYETSWYSSNQLLYKMVKQDSIGEVRKMVAHDGHQGPKEIHVSKEFFQWLTDPKTNGAGALYDFGCYGANLMTWLMDGQAPISVTAVTKHIKPDIYPKADDDATIILEYPKATGIIEASWNWPFGIKDWEVFGVDGYLQAVNRNTLRSRKNNQDDYTLQQLDPPQAPYQDYIPYVAAVLRGEIHPGNDLSSLENNLIVVKILAAAKLSAKKGKRILLK